MIRLGKTAKPARQGGKLKKQRRISKKTSCKTPKSPDSETECEKTTIIGKKIQNTGILDLSQEIGEIKRILTNC